MKTQLIRFIALIFAPLAALVWTSCSTPPPPAPVRDSSTNYVEGIPGGVTVDTYEVTTAVSAIDHEKRTATLLTSDGTEIPYKAGPNVPNFDQVRVGDHVKTTVAEQVVVFVREKSGRRNNDGQANLVALNPKGEKPGVVTAGTVEVTTRVKAVDLEHHKATLLFPDGTTKVISVRPDVKLSPSDVGREVVIQATRAVAVRVEKP
jgi:translation elongation factor P/translation initiation factor 5A